MGVLLRDPDARLQILHLGMVGAMLGEEGAFAAGHLVEPWLPDGRLFLQLAERVAAAVPAATAPPPAAAATLPVVPLGPAHLDPQRGDLILGADEGTEGALGAAGFA